MLHNPVVYLRERNLNMLKKDLMLRNPLKAMFENEDGMLSPGRFGAILARAGIGKTSLLVQIALNSMLNGRNVLHISLNDPVKKVCLWYEEVFRNITNRHDRPVVNRLWETALPHRLIMTFNVDGFSMPKLEERLDDLIEQNIYVPEVILIDGMPFTETTASALTELKTLAARLSASIWFTVKIHRHEGIDSTEIPQRLKQFEKLFELIFQLQPKNGKIYLVNLKDKQSALDKPAVFLDPSTMLIIEGGELKADQFLDVSGGS